MSRQTKGAHRLHAFYTLAIQPLALGKEANHQKENLEM
jgi:hypothetical protein